MSFDAAGVYFQRLLEGSALVLYCFQLMVSIEAYQQAVNEVMKNLVYLV